MRKMGKELFFTFDFDLVSNVCGPVLWLDILLRDYHSHRNPSSVPFSIAFEGRNSRGSSLAGLD